MEPQPAFAQRIEQNRQAGTETVASVLKIKGRQVFSIGPDENVYDAIGMMASHRVGVLLVMAASDLVGIISERDYTWKVILKGHSSKETLVRQIMCQPVIAVTPEHTVEQCLRIMTRHRIRHLPVVQGRTVLGLVSIGDLVNSLLSMQAHTIDQLETYITSSYPK